MHLRAVNKKKKCQRDTTIFIVISIHVIHEFASNDY